MKPAIRPRRVHRVESKPIGPRPEWNTNVTDMDRYKLSLTKMMEKKSMYISKNTVRAKEEVNKIIESIQAGTIPTEVMQVIAHKKSQPKFRSTMAGWNKENMSENKKPKITSSKKETIRPHKAYESTTALHTVKPMHSPQKSEEDDEDFTIKPVKFVSSSTIRVTKPMRNSVIPTDC